MPKDTGYISTMNNNPALRNRQGRLKFVNETSQSSGHHSVLMEAIIRQKSWLMVDRTRSDAYFFINMPLKGVWHVAFGHTWPCYKRDTHGTFILSLHF